MSREIPVAPDRPLTEMESRYWELRRDGLDHESAISRLAYDIGVDDATVVRVLVLAEPHSGRRKRLKAGKPRDTPKTKRMAKNA